MSDRNVGLYEKYHVKRMRDDEGKHDDCEFFVLDLVHDPYAIPALEAYIEACQSKYPKLASDLRVQIFAMKQA